MTNNLLRMESDFNDIIWNLAVEEIKPEYIKTKEYDFNKISTKHKKKVLELTESINNSNDEQYKSETKIQIDKLNIEYKVICEINDICEKYDISLEDGFAAYNITLDIFKNSNREIESECKIQDCHEDIYQKEVEIKRIEKEIDKIVKKRDILEEKHEKLLIDVRAKDLLLSDKFEELFVNSDENDDNELMSEMLKMKDEELKQFRKQSIEYEMEKCELELVEYKTTRQRHKNKKIENCEKKYAELIKQYEELGFKWKKPDNRYNWQKIWDGIDFNN